MKLHQLFESDSTIDIVKFLTDVRPFLDEVMKSKGHGLLYHGTNSMPEYFTKLKFKMRSGPKDLDPRAHDYLNDWFMSEFGVKARNWMFVTGSQSFASSYGGTVRAIFPIGKFQWVYNENIHDMMQTWDAVEYQYMTDNDIEFGSELTDDQVQEIGNALMYMDGEHFKFNKDLGEGINSGVEMTITGDSFYAVHPHILLKTVSAEYSGPEELRKYYNWIRDAI